MEYLFEPIGADFWPWWTGNGPDYCLAVDELPGGRSKMYNAVKNGVSRPGSVLGTSGNRKIYRTFGNIHGKAKFTRSESVVCCPCVLVRDLP